MTYKYFDPESLGKKSWFPGHMKKAWDEMAKSLKIVDVVLELRDARVPLSSQNDHFEKIVQHKKRLIIFNKTGLADPRRRKGWEAYFKAQGRAFLFVDALSGLNMQRILPAVSALKPTGKIRIMVVGIPNVGKSTMINQLCRRKAARVGFLPGVTRSQQWVKVSSAVELMDTPGVLYGGGLDPEKAMRLCVTGGLKSEVITPYEQAGYILQITSTYPGMAEKFCQVYKLGEFPPDFHSGLEAVGRSRGLLLKGGQIDLERAAVLIGDDFKHGKFGEYTLDQVPA